MLQWLPNIICAVYAYAMVQKANIGMGELVVFLMILQKFVDAYVSMPFNMVDARENMVCVNRVEKILAQSDEESGTNTADIVTDVTIAFENVVFLCERKGSA